MDRARAKKQLEEATNRVMGERFTKELGSKAIVERTVLTQDERTEQLDEVLADIGRDYQESGHVPKGMKYMGSVACHFFVAETIGQFANIGQINPQPGCADSLLVSAADDLKTRVLQYCGKNAPKKRSGF